MHSSIKKPSLAKDCLVLSIALMVLIVIISIIIGYSVYRSQQQHRVLIHQAAASHIDDSLTESFNYATYYMKFLGEKLVQNGTDPDYIAELFYNKMPDNVVERNTYAWSLFDFVDINKQMIINSVKGKLDKPLDVSMRSYVKDAEKWPWKLFFATPSWGVASGEWIIPAGIGINDHKGKFYGIIATGFDVNRLTDKLEKSISLEGINFAILDSNFETVAYSSDIQHDLGRNFFVKSLPRKLKQNTVHEGALQYPIAYSDNISFFYFKKSADYPFYILIGENDNAVNLAFKEVVLPRVIELSFVGFFCITILYYLRRRIVVPITSLAKAAQRITKEEDVLIPTGHYAEINELASQLDDIQQVKKQLIMARETVKEANESLEQKVMERTLELEKALKARTGFLNNMSHEIKTPVHGVINFAEILVEDWDNLNDAKRLDYAKKIQRNSERLYSLVSNLLDLSKLSVNKMQFMMIKRDLKALAQDVIEECEPLYLGKKDLFLKLEINPPDLKTLVYLDKERITQVLRNLLSNAIKFTSHGDIMTTISLLTIKYEDGRVIPGLAISVRDEGVGIPASELKEIFDVFSQSSRTKTLAGGTGLGLSICHEIITAHQGMIWAENNTEGKGSNFVFVIPYR
jgi:two-component system sensor histidine kinase ChiS